MLKKHLQNTYPIFYINIKKNNCKFIKIENISNFLKEEISKHPIASFIACFDHCNHTNNIEEKEMSQDIIGAKIISFCFGKKLTDPLQLSIRPRSIGIAETKENFIISCLESPNSQTNEIMQKWIKSLIK